MNSILVQDIFNGKFNDVSIPAIAYGEYDGVYDEDLDYIGAVGVSIDNNIYFANCFGELESVLQNDIYISRAVVTGVSTVKGLINAIRFSSTTLEGCDRTAKAYVKDYKGYVLPIKEIIEDKDADRLVFVAERCING